MKQISEQLYYIRCKENVLCPCCGCQLRVIGSRKRKYINNVGEEVTLIIRRLKCSYCKRIHHELPDILVPYKRYGCGSIENILTESDICSIVAAEDSTFYRWKKWSELLYLKIKIYLLSILDKLEIKHRVWNYDRTMSYLKNFPKWLSISVTRLVNLDFW